MNSLSLLISAITPIDSVASPSDINVHIILVLSPEFQEGELFPISNLITWSLGWHGLEQPVIQLHQNFYRHRFFFSGHRPVTKLLGKDATEVKRRRSLDFDSLVPAVLVTHLQANGAISVEIESTKPDFQA